MPVRSSSAVWRGELRGGEGTLVVGDGVFEGAYSFPSRFESGAGTNPEEHIGAAHAGCFSMALSGILGRAGHRPESVKTTARVHLDKVGEGFKITKIELHTEARVPGLADADFQKHAQQAKEGCPVSQALAVDIELQARLVG